MNRRVGCRHPVQPLENRGIPPCRMELAERSNGGLGVRGRAPGRIVADSERAKVLQQEEIGIGWDIEKRAMVPRQAQRDISRRLPIKADLALVELEDTTDFS